MTDSFLCDGLADASVTFLLAHGAGAPMDSPFLQVVAEELARRHWGVVRFEFPYICLLYTSPSPRDQRGSRMPSSA